MASDNVSKNIRLFNDSKKNKLYLKLREKNMEKKKTKPSFLLCLSLCCIVLMGVSAIATPLCREFNLKTRVGAPQGFSCITDSGATFLAVTPTDKNGSKVWLDLNKGMMFYVFYRGINSYNLALQACSRLPSNDGKPWSLASGYPLNFSNKYGNRPSDLIVLDADGFTNLMNLNKKEQWFWISSPPTPYYQVVTFNSSFSGRARVVYNYGSDDTSLGAVCTKPLK